MRPRRNAESAKDRRKAAEQGRQDHLASARSPSSSAFSAFSNGITHVRV